MPTRTGSPRTEISTWPQRHLPLRTVMADGVFGTDRASGCFLLELGPGLQERQRQEEREKTAETRNRAGGQEGQCHCGSGLMGPQCEPDGSCKSERDRDCGKAREVLE